MFLLGETNVIFESVVTYAKNNIGGMFSNFPREHFQRATLSECRRKRIVTWNSCGCFAIISVNPWYGVLLSGTQLFSISGLVLWSYVLYCMIPAMQNKRASARSSNSNILPCVRSVAYIPYYSYWHSVWRLPHWLCQGYETATAGLSRRSLQLGCTRFPCSRCTANPAKLTE